MNGDIKQPRLTVQGPIKWFDPVKGFGFLADSAGGSDVLLHSNVLRNFGQSSVAAGALVEVRCVVTARGRQAVEVVSIQPPATAGQAPIADLSMMQEDDLARLPLLPARVKWFDAGKGFGFANVFGRRGDVFLHIEVLRYWGFADLVPGEAVALRIVDGPRGAIAAQVLAWDRAAGDDAADDESGSSGGGNFGAGGVGQPADGVAEDAPLRPAQARLRLVESHHWATLR